MPWQRTSQKKLRVEDVNIRKKYQKNKRSRCQHTRGEADEERAGSEGESRFYTGIRETVYGGLSGNYKKA